MPGRYLSIGVTAAGAAVVVLVGRDGSLVWITARTLLVALLTLLTLLGIAVLDQQVGARLARFFGGASLVVATGFVLFLVKHGPGPTAIASTVGMVAGLVLVIAGTVVAGRGQGRVRRAAGGLGVLAVLGISMLVVTPAVLATNVPRPALDAWPADRGLVVEDHRLVTSDGVELAAWYVPSRNGAAVVLRHGAGSTRSSVLDHAEVLVRHGFGVLMMDARGHGESTGRAMDFGWSGDPDIGAGTSFLAARPEVDPGRIGLVGMSMGGEEAIGASASDPLVRAVVAEGATARTGADEAWLSEEYGVRGLLQEQLERAQDVILALLTDAPRPISLRGAVVASAEVHYLLITAGQVADEGHAARHVASGAPERVEVWTVQGAGHTQGLRTVPVEWEDRVIGFLSETLGISSPPR